MIHTVVHLAKINNNPEYTKHNDKYYGDRKENAKRERVDNLGDFCPFLFNSIDTFSFGFFLYSSKETT